MKVGQQIVRTNVRVDNINNNISNGTWFNNKRINMKEIDQMLNKWIYNTIIRERFREIIVKEINKYKLNTNTNG